MGDELRTGWVLAGCVDLWRNERSIRPQVAAVACRAGLHFVIHWHRFGGPFRDIRALANDGRSCNWARVESFANVHRRIVACPFARQTRLVEPTHDRNWDFARTNRQLAHRATGCSKCDRPGYSLLVEWAGGM